MGRLSHRENRSSKAFFSAKCACHGQQFFSVAWSGRAEAYNGVITRMLTFASNAARREPEDRIEPVDGSRCVGQHLNNPVMSLDMRQFMSQHHPNAIIRPAFGISRKKDSWNENSPCSKKRNRSILQKANRPADTQASTDFISQLSPTRVLNRFRSNGYPCQSAGAIQQKQDPGGSSRDPDPYCRLPKNFQGNHDVLNETRDGRNDVCLPRRQRHREQRNCHRANQARRPDCVAERCRLLLHQRSNERCRRQDNRRLDDRDDHLRDPFLALSMRSARRSSSSSESFLPDPSKVESIVSVEPSKNVSIVWNNADCRTAWRGVTGR